MLSDFKPTYLYIKQHNITKKLYFGKTTVSDIASYDGSGHIWKRHIKKHGKEHVITRWYKLFENHDDCEEFALFFSEVVDIVNSDNWLNLIPENGKDGSPIGKHSKERCNVNSAAQIKWHQMHPEESAKKVEIMRQSNLGRVQSAETKKKRAESWKISLTDEVRKKLSDTQKNKPKSKESIQKRLKTMEGKVYPNRTGGNITNATCPHCGKTGGKSNMTRYHFDNCRSKK